MLWLNDLYVSIRDFFEAGGPVLWPIFILAIVMWMFIIERYWYFRFVHPDVVKQAIDEWQHRADQQSWYAKRVRDRILSQASVEISRYIDIIKTLIAVVPLLGLLGTVTGMIAVFDVMASIGTGNARAMASGISQATIPTMAAMTVAISGLYFASALESRAASEREELGDHLRHF